MLKIATRRSVFSVVTAACLVSGFAFAGLVPATAAGGSGSRETSASGTGAEVLPSTGGTSALKPIPADSVDSADADPDGFWELNQAPLGTATATIEEQFPDEFAYAFFDDASAMHVAFTGAAPADAVTLLENTGLPYVVVESVGFNAAEYEAAAADVVEQTLKYVTEDRQVTVSQDPALQPGAIEVSFQSNDPELTTDPGITTPSAGARAQSPTVDSPFITIFDDTNTSPREFTSFGRMAGTWLVNSTGNGECTSGFVVKSNNSSSLGVLTAGHCSTNLRYFYSPTGEVQQLSLEARTVGSMGDVMFQRSPVMMDAWFHTGAGSGKHVVDVRNPFQNEAVKAYGRGSNYEHNGRVQAANTQTSIIMDGSWATIGGQVSVDMLMGGGDSGGPLYGGNTAMGILSGQSLDFAYFTKIKNAEAAMNVTVCREPVCS